MNKFAIIEILEALTEPEQQELLDAARSPFFTREYRNHKSGDFEKLLTYLLKCGGSGGGSFEKSEAWKAVFGADRIFVEATFHSLMSHSLRLVQRFVHVKQSGWNDIEAQQRSLLQFYRLRNLTLKFRNLLAHARAIRPQIQGVNPNVLFNFFQVEQEAHLDAAANNLKLGDLNLTTTLRHLDQYYASAKLQLSIVLAAQRQVTQVASEEFIQTNLLFNLLTSKTTELEPFLQCLLHAHALVGKVEGHNEHFLNLRRLARENVESFDREYNYLFAGALRNYCTWRYNSGDADFLPELLDIVRENWATGLYKTEGRVTPTFLHSVVRIALKMNDLEWLRTILFEEKPALLGDKSDEAFYRFFQAKYHAAAGQPAEAERLLLMEDSASYYAALGDLHMVLDACQLEIRIFYVLEQPDDFLYDKLKAYRNRIVRAGSKTLPKTHAAAFLKFIEYTRHLISLREKIRRAARHDWPAVRADIQKLKTEIEHSPSADREWVQEQLEVLLSKMK